VFQIVWGDDEHTAAEDIYARLMKSRKWLVLGAVSATAVAQGLVHFDKIIEVTKVIEVPRWIAAQGIGLGLVYAQVQFLLLLVQLFQSYPVVLDSRLGGRQETGLEAAGEKLASLQSELAAARQTNNGRAHHVERRIWEHKRRMSSLERSDLRSNAWVRNAEFAIDLFRISTPVLLSLLALGMLLASGAIIPAR